MVFKSLFAGLFLSFLLLSCSKTGNRKSFDFIEKFGVPDSSYYPVYAKGFVIHYYGVDKLVEVANPWDSLQVPDFFLIDNSGTLQFKNVPSIKAPVSNWSAFSSSQVVMAEALDVLHTLKSVAEPEYITNQEVIEGLRNRVIRNVGLASAPDMEILLLSQPEFVFVSPFMDNSYDQMREAGLTIISDAGYLERTPLGRVEWLVFFGAFFNREVQAYELFREIEKQYRSVTSVTSGILNRPSMTTGYLFQNIWFLPAGDSYLATLFRDAGAYYPYESVPGYGSVAYDFEKVFHDTYQCDYWVMTVNHPTQFTYADLREMDERYADFKSFKERKVILSNTSHSGYFEHGWMQPHVLVQDLASFFHPGLFPKHEPVYFQLLP